MFDQFSYGYLGFTLGPDGRTLYYLTGGPVYVGGKRVAGKSKTAMGESKGIEDLHLITWDVPTGKYARSRRDLLRRRATACLREFDRRGERWHGLRPVTHHREQQNPDRPDEHSRGAHPRSDPVVPDRRGMIPREHCSS